MSDLFSASGEAGSGIAEDTFIPLPPEKKVIFYNDDFTPMDFVVDVLVSIFNKNQAEATTLMKAVHEEGKAVVGTYTYDIAVTRANLTKQVARRNEFPLRVEVE